ncbi:MAG: hypothetical protein ACK47B_20160 [Armatimonadota bacterium]
MRSDGDTTTETAPVDVRPRSDRVSVVAFGLLAYVVAVAVLLLLWNDAAGGLVQGWYDEYVREDGTVSGSGKWRSIEGKAFSGAATLLGTPAYFFAIPTSVLFAVLACERRSWREKALCIVCAPLSLYALYRMESIGLLRAVWGF